MQAASSVETTPLPQSLCRLAEERGSDCGYPVALFLFALCLMASHFVYRIVCVSKIRDPRLGHMRTVIVTAAGVLVQLLFAAIEQGAGVSSSLTGAFGLRATHTTLVIAVVLSSLLLTHGGVVFLVYTSKNRKVMVENFLRQCVLALRARALQFMIAQALLPTQVQGSPVLRRRRRRLAWLQRRHCCEDRRAKAYHAQDIFES